MVRFLLGSRLVEGRLVHEDVKTLRVESFAGSVIGYDKAGLKDLQRYELSVAQYYEKAGDYYADRLWDFDDDLNDFAQVRKAYQKSLSGAESASVQQKLQSLERDREEWQKEFRRRKDIEEAEARAEAAKIEKQMAEKQAEGQAKLAEALEAQGLELKELGGRVRGLEDTTRLMRDRISELRRDVERLERNMLEQWNSIRIYFRNIHIEGEQE
jgi:predicted nuclease with TOPRIM domain